MPDLFISLFPDVHHVYTIEEIATRVHRSTEQAREAQNTLARREATRELVRPTDGQRPAHYSPEAARLIARHLVRGEDREALRREVECSHGAVMTALLDNQQLLLTLLQQLGPMLRVMQIVARFLAKNERPESP